jgi:hypothetical protein
MIVSLHVATGAAAGRLLGSRRRALVAGPLLHLAGDATPHRDVESFVFELWSGVAALLFVAAARGPLDPATLGGLAAVLPDVEHRLRLPRPGGRELFPSHRWRPLHQEGGLSTATQIVAAGAMLGWVAAGRRTS